MSTATATVTGVDVYAWMEPIEGTIPTRYNHNIANRGDVIEVTDTELARGVDMGALTKGKVETRAKAAAPADAADLSPDLTDEELGKLPAAQLVAWIGQNEDQADRVAALEAERKEPRVSVLRAAGVEPA